MTPGGEHAGECSETAKKRGREGIGLELDKTRSGTFMVKRVEEWARQLLRRVKQEGKVERLCEVREGVLVLSVGDVPCKGCSLEEVKALVQRQLKEDGRVKLTFSPPSPSSHESKHFSFWLAPHSIATPSMPHLPPFSRHSGSKRSLTPPPPCLLLPSSSPPPLPRALIARGTLCIV